MVSASTRRGSVRAVTAPARAYHHGDLRRALLEGAERALDDGGARALSLRAVAREIGVSHAAPSRHFADKQELLDALALEGFRRLGDDMDAALARAPATFEARFGAVAHAYVSFATEHAALLELMYDSKHRAGGAGDALRAAADHAFAAPLGLVCDAQAAGDIVAGDPDGVATVAWATLHGLAAMHNSGMLGDAPLGAVVTGAVTRLVEGLRPR